MQKIMLVASAVMLVSCTMPEMRTAAANSGSQQTTGGSMREYEARPPLQLSQPPRIGWASNYRSTPR